MPHLMLAAEESLGPMAFNWVPYFTTLVVFAVVFGILATVIWPKILGALDAREQKILSDLRSADEAREQAKRALADYERSLAQAREEAGRMIAQAKAAATATAAELRARNEVELGELKQRAAREIAAAKTAAVSEIHTEAANLAAAMARKILGREVTVGDQQRLVEESLREMEAARRN